jgi:hypothetical protein
MRLSPRWIVVLVVVSSTVLAGCVISEQTGQMPQKLPGFGSGYSAPEDITYHFDSGFNWAMVLGRSLLILLVAGWLFFSVGGALSRGVAVVLLVIAGWLAYQGLMTVARYRLEVDIDHGVRFTVPPAATVDIPFDTIDSLEVSGYEWQRGQTTPGFGPGAQPTTVPFTELPAWRSMTIVTKDGRSLDVDVERLSVEQRQGLLNAIVRFGGLIEEK